MDELRLKEFPENYPEDAINILENMSFTHGKSLLILGSMSLRAQQYAGDYDGYEIVKLNEKNDETALKVLAKRFKEMIRSLKKIKDCFIGDIKAGVIEEWRVIPKDSYNAKKSKEKVDELLSKKIITIDEAKSAKELLVNKPTISQLLYARQKIKFHIIRWKPDEVLKGKKQIRGGLTITLEQAFGSPTIAKLDVIGFVQQNRFTDFSVIYEFHNKGHPLNPDKIDIVKSLKENIIAYENEGNIFKSLKRRFALAKYEGDHKIIHELTPILNSDLGRLYIIIGDIGTLIALLEDYKAPKTKIKYEINQFKNRLANIYTLRDYLKNENKILSEIDSIVKRPTGTMVEPLSKLRDELEKYLQDNTKKIIKDMKVLKGSGDFDAELQEALSRNPKIREDVNKGTAVVRTKFFDDGIRGIVSEDKWRQGYERRKQSPPEPYKSFRDKVIDRLLQRSLEIPAETERLKKAQETLAETNKKYADFYAANPEYEPVLCNLNEKLEPVKDRGVPKAVCEERHRQKIKNMERERAARDPFNPVMKGIFSVGDVLSNVLPTIAPGVGTVLKTAWDTTRGIADPEGEYTDEGVKKLTSMGIDALMANENKGKGRSTGFVRRLIAEQMKEPTKPILDLSKMKTKPSASLKKIAEKVKPRETHAERQRKKEKEKFYKERQEQLIKMLETIKYATENWKDLTTNERYSTYVAIETTNSPVPKIMERGYKNWVAKLRPVTYRMGQKKGGNRNTILTHFLHILEANRRNMIQELINLYNNASDEDKTELNDFCNESADLHGIGFLDTVDFTLRVPPADPEGAEVQRNYLIGSLLDNIDTARSSPINL